MSKTGVQWKEQPQACRLYVLAVYVLSIPFAILCFTERYDYSLEWFLLTVTSIFVATINVRLPKLSAVISMGDVFIILILMRFGAGPALLTYWIDNTVAYSSD